MEKTQINLREEFKQNLCSFEVAKKAKAAGMTCANTYFAYDKDGNIGDGGWMEDEKNIKMIREQTGKPNWQPPVFYPAINLAFAIGMLEHTDIDFGNFECFEIWDEKKGLEFVAEYEGKEVFKSKNLTDLFVEVWIKHKNKD